MADAELPKDVQKILAEVKKIAEALNTDANWLLSFSPELAGTCSQLQSVAQEVSNEANEFLGNPLEELPESHPERRLTALEHVTEQHEQQLTTITNTIEGLKKDLLGLANRVTRLEVWAGKWKVWIQNNIIANITKLQDQVTKNQLDGLAAAQAETERFRKEVVTQTTAITTQLEAQKKQLETFGAALKGLRDQNAAITKTVQDLIKNIVVPLTENVNKIREVQEEMTPQIAAVNAKIKEFEEKAAAIKAITDQLAQVEGLVNKDAVQISNLQHDLTIAKETTQKSIADLEKKMDNLRKAGTKPPKDTTKHVKDAASVVINAIGMLGAPLDNTRQGAQQITESLKGAELLETAKNYVQEMQSIKQSIEKLIANAQQKLVKEIDKVEQAKKQGKGPEPGQASWTGRKE